MEYTIHIANVLYLLSYSMRDVLWLRILTVIAIGFLIPYFYLRSEPLMAPIYWNLLFTAINLYWIARLLNERRPVRLSDDEQRLCRLGFRTLTPRDMLKLLKLAAWHDTSPGTSPGACSVPGVMLHVFEEKGLSRFSHFYHGWNYRVDPGIYWVIESRRETGK